MFKLRGTFFKYPEITRGKFLFCFDKTTVDSLLCIMQYISTCSVLGYNILSFFLDPRYSTVNKVCHVFFEDITQMWSTRFYRWIQGEFGEGNGSPLQYSCLENPMDGGAWWAAVHGVTKSRTRLSDFTFTFHFSCIGEGNGNPHHCSCLEDPRDGGAWWVAVCGVAQSRTWLKWLSSKVN